MASHQQPFKHGSGVGPHLPCHFLRCLEGGPCPPSQHLPHDRRASASRHDLCFSLSFTTVLPRPGVPAFCVTKSGQSLQVEVLRFLINTVGCLFTQCDWPVQALITDETYEFTFNNGCTCPCQSRLGSTVGSCGSLHRCTWNDGPWGDHQW